MFRHASTFTGFTPFTDTCDCCGKDFEPWLLVQVAYGEWLCMACVQPDRDDNPDVDLKELYDE
jgi:hypothetical protein